MAAPSTGGTLEERIAARHAGQRGGGYRSSPAEVEARAAKRARIEAEHPTPQSTASSAGARENKPPEKEAFVGCGFVLWPVSCTASWFGVHHLNNTGAQKHDALEECLRPPENPELVLDGSVTDPEFERQLCDVFEKSASLDEAQFQQELRLVLGLKEAGERTIAEVWRLEATAIAGCSVSLQSRPDLYISDVVPIELKNNSKSTFATAYGQLSRYLLATLYIARRRHGSTIDHVFGALFMGGKCRCEKKQRVTIVRLEFPSKIGAPPTTQYAHCTAAAAYHCLAEFVKSTGFGPSDDGGQLCGNMLKGTPSCKQLHSSSAHVFVFSGQDAGSLLSLRPPDPAALEQMTSAQGQFVAKWVRNLALVAVTAHQRQASSSRE
eukprot:4357906-Amphidinium_carterae.1